MSVFGKQLQKEEFLLQDGGIFLNHGSYGTAPKPVQNEKLRYLAEVESQPDVWFRRLRYGTYKQSIQSAAEFVGADPENLVFVANTTSGINHVFKNLPIGPGDGILTYDWTYGAVKNIMDVVAAKTGAKVHRIELRIPIQDKQEVVDKYRQILDDNKDIKYVILDYISSVPPVLMPLGALITLCKSRGLTVMVDGAHTPGQLPLNLETMGADFYVGNLHKWAFAPRGCAVLWVHPRYHDLVRPLVTSLARPTFQEDHQYQGTDDFSNYYASRRALQFYGDMGGMDAIGPHNRDLVARGAALLIRKWGTTRFPIPEDMEAPFMRMVRLPDLRKFPAAAEETGSVTALYGDLHEFTMYMWDRFRIQTLGLFVQGEPWVRLSAQVYNSLEDYERLAAAVLTLVREEQE